MYANDVRPPHCRPQSILHSKPKPYHSTSYFKPASPRRHITPRRPIQRHISRKNTKDPISGFSSVSVLIIDSIYRDNMTCIRSWQQKKGRGECQFVICKKEGIHRTCHSHRLTFIAAINSHSKTASRSKSKSKKELHTTRTKKTHHLSSSSVLFCSVRSGLEEIVYSTNQTQNKTSIDQSVSQPASQPPVYDIRTSLKPSPFPRQAERHQS